MLNISIPTPCHEDWNRMTNTQNGRHCSSCMKTVIDFSSMSDDEVKNFLVSRTQEKICGRFSRVQLQRIQIELPQNIFMLEIPLWKQFLLACLIVFSTTLFSCEVKHKPVEVMTTTGLVVTEVSRDTGSESQMAIDSPIDRQMLTGEVAYPIDTATVPVPGVETYSTGSIMGDIDIEPDTLVTKLVSPAPPDSTIPAKKDSFDCKKFY